MAIATINTYLNYKATAGGTYAKLIDITEFPDLGGTPEQIDVTTLTNTTRQYIQGVKDTSDVNFTANFDKTAYETINGLTTTTYFQVLMADGSAFQFTGTASAYVNGGGVNEAVTMTITIYPTSDVTFVAAN